MMAVLKEYVDRVIPRMIDAGYHLRLVKGRIDTLRVESKRRGYCETTFPDLKEVTEQ